MNSSSQVSNRFRNIVLTSLVVAGGLAAVGYHASRPASSRLEQAHAEQATAPDSVSHSKKADSAAQTPVNSPDAAPRVIQEEMPTPPALEAPAIESPDVIATMDIEFVRDEVKRLDKELEERKAIERLNGDEVSPEERAELGALFQRAALFRHRLMEDEVESLSNTVAAYEKTHAARVAELTKGIPSR